MLKHGRETPGREQVESNHQFLFSNEDFFIVLLLHRSPRNAYFWRLFDVPYVFLTLWKHYLWLPMLED